MRGARLLPPIVLLALAVASVRPQLFQIFAIDRARAEKDVARLADPDVQYRAFIDAVSRATPPSSRIAIIAPAAKWDIAYQHAYYRASYLLAGREVLPVIWRGDRAVPEHVETADFIAVWQRRFEPSDAVPVVTAHGGTLYRRTQ